MSKILLADDTDFMRRMLRGILEKEGHQIAAEANNGRDAVECFKNTEVDLVVLDITMPIMDGIEALKEIMKLNPQAKVIMCSALGNEQKILEAIQSGAKDFIVKPFKSERVISSIKRLGL